MSVCAGANFASKIIFVNFVDLQRTPEKTFDFRFWRPAPCPPPNDGAGATRSSPHTDANAVERVSYLDIPGPCIGEISCEAEARSDGMHKHAGVARERFKAARTPSFYLVSGYE